MTTPDPVNLALPRRRIDIFFAVVFAAFMVTSVISDLLPTIGVNFSHPSGNFFVQSNYWYAHDADPLFMNPPDWMRIVTGLLAVLAVAAIVINIIWTSSPGNLPAATLVGGTAPLGQLLFRQFLLPFEILSLLLLVAMLGVILLSKKELK